VLSDLAGPGVMGISGGLKNENSSTIKQLMQLGWLLLHVFFLHHQQGDYGPTLQTARGLATRGRPSERSYFSIFGKLKVERYLYSVGSMSFAPLDQFLNLPRRCYSYFLAERVNLLNIKDSYAETVNLLQRFFDLKLSVSAAETISQESAVLVICQRAVHQLRIRFPEPESFLKNP
jgi:hypothetical protein